MILLLAGADAAPPGNGFDFLTPLLQYGVGAVPAFILWLWLKSTQGELTDEKDKREKAEERERSFAERAIPVLGAAVDTIKAATTGAAQAADQVPKRNDLDVVLRRLEQLADGLADAGGDQRGR